MIPELPRTRETLLLRLMGAGRTLREALEDFRALPADAPERAVVGPLLVQLQHDLPRMQAITVTLSQEDAEDMMSYEEAVRIWNETERERRETQAQLAQAERQITEVRRQATQAREQATQAREQATRAQHALEHQFERRLHRTLTDAERDTLRVRLAALGPERLGDVVLDLDGDTLAAWIADPNAS